jgi:hypothetical protein
MENFLKAAGCVVVGVAIGCFLAAGGVSFGGVYNQTTKYFENGGLKVGQNGSTFAELKATTCDLIGSNASQAASTTVAYDCAVTGIASGDVVLAQLASSTPGSASQAGSWEIQAAKASTTAGYVTVLLKNNGAAAVPSVTGVGSSTNLWFADI